MTGIGRQRMTAWVEGEVVVFFVGMRSKRPCARMRDRRTAR
jgi:hypothetical protein